MFDTISNPPNSDRRPNLADYGQVCTSFDWNAAMLSELDGLPQDRGLNIAHEAVDRHALGTLADTRIQLNPIECGLL